MKDLWDFYWIYEIFWDYGIFFEISFDM